LVASIVTSEESPRTFTTMSGSRIGRALGDGSPRNTVRGTQCRADSERHPFPCLEGGRSMAFVHSCQAKNPGRGTRGM
jgi:hypothetical protein